MLGPGPSSEETARIVGRSRGQVRALLINNMLQFHGGVYTAASAEQDLQRMQKLFQRKFKMVVTTRADLNNDDFEDALEQFQETFDEETDACLIMLMTDARNKKDYQIDLRTDLIDKFSNRKFAAMAGKPKIFIIQAQR